MEDYKPDELLMIAHSFVIELGYKLSDEANYALKQQIDSLYYNRDKNFGNAGAIRNIVKNLISSVDYRVSQIPVNERDKMDKRLILEIDV
ncbi:hypothetical protein [Halalkalibacter okhensis]|uniref:CbbX AAA lid domain-containing protein n=1 Tax=Halalkalibacter okhensis TaxID=333138 RepID=A0A0B0IB07_9BACI|nr:hypothetical protein [Halalkalibacter okhensis]KHF38460.1 hypothetical protein LQ50_21260 [Halalkalibacter okhensis]